MVPLRLTPRNFLSYRDCPPVDLEYVHVACLTGDNGNGKSALLDALTWALWGKARTRFDADLVSLGQSEMEVELEFAVGEARHRVIRKWRRTGSRGSGQTTLDFQGWDGSGWRNHSGSSVTETQQRIIDVLKLTYDTFVNSAFLMQGRADMFTVKSPAERKQVLADILELDRYDVYEDRAKQRRNERERQATMLERQIGDADYELTKLDDVRREREETHAALADATERLTKVRLEREALQTRQALAQSLAAQARQLEQQRHDAAREEAAAQARIEARQQEIARAAAVAREAEAVRAGYEQLQATRAANEEQQRQLRRVNEVQREQQTLERAVQAAEQQVMREVSRLEAQVQQLDMLVAGRERLLAVRAAQAQDEEGLAVERTHIATLREDETRDRAQVATLKADNERLLAEAREAKRKMDELRYAVAHGDANCPLCASALGHDGLEAIRAQHEHEGRAKQDQLKTNRAAIEALEAAARDALNKREQLELALDRRLRQLNEERGATEANLARAEAAVTERAPVAAALAAAQARLTARDVARAEQDRLGALTAELDAIGYDQAVADRLAARLAELAPYERRYQECVAAEQALTAAEAARQEAAAACEAWAARRAAAEAHLMQAQEQLATVADVGPRLAVVEEEARGLDLLRSRLQLTAGAMDADLDRLEALAETTTARRRELRRVQIERAAYEDLARAFGKSGVQALIIDAVLPELETTANDLLSRMTNGRMAVTLDTQRTTQKGTVQETLDIRIADETGTRGYELYSGGEAFRINLALRIALSKLLARRAGAPLPTLVIDEGFGTQDAAGRERLVEALNVIQHDFQRLLVVTHIDELKELFETRIEVRKTPTGSVAEVVTG